MMMLFRAITQLLAGFFLLNWDLLIFLGNMPVLVRSYHGNIMMRTMERSLQDFAQDCSKISMEGQPGFPPIESMDVMTWCLES